MKIRLIIAAFILVTLPFLIGVRPTQASTPLQVCGESDLFCPATKANILTSTLETFPDPNIASPHSMFAAVEFTIHMPITRIVPYMIDTRGNVEIPEQQFAERVHTILADPRGWSRLGVQFERVEAGGEFTIVLSQVTHVPSFGPPCDAEFNCKVGDFVVVNEDRWLLATQPWNNAGGNVPNYQHLVINHELGHWLGHDHPACPGIGGASPVMMQQSIDLGGCKFSAWPLDTEIWSTRLGI